MLQRKIKKLLSFLTTEEITLSTLEEYSHDEDSLYILRLLFLLVSLFEEEKKEEKKTGAEQKFDPVSTLFPLHYKFFIPLPSCTRKYFVASSYFL